MKFTAEQINRAKNAKSAEELLIIARESGYYITEEQSKLCFIELHKERELTDEELSKVAGGKTYPEEEQKGSAPNPGKPAPPAVNIDSGNPVCPRCGARVEVKYDYYQLGGLSDDEGPYDLFFCTGCNAIYRRHWFGDLWTED